MVKTEFYVAGGDNVTVNTNLKDCTKICEIDGILYDYDGNRQKLVFDEIKQGYTQRVIIKYSDLIDSKGVIRRIIFSVG